MASRLLKCAECGGALVGSSAHGANKVHRYYVHSHKKGDVINCTYKRHSAEEIETAIAEHLVEILLQAGHFEKVSETIRQSITVKPEELKRQRAHLTAELQTIKNAIDRTFKIQAQMDADSEGIRLVAQELETLGRKKKVIADQLEQLRATESYSDDADDAIGDLKERLEAFKRGWKNASPMAKKSLLSDLLWGVIVSPQGLSIEFRLKHGLNSNGFLDPKSTSSKSNGSVIDLAAHRRTNPLPADAGSEIHNGDVEKLQVVGFGRGCAKVFEPAGLTVSRDYEVPWKKQGLDIAELARLRFEEGLGSRVISQRLGAPRTTVIGFIHRLEKARGIR